MGESNSNSGTVDKPRETKAPPKSPIEDKPERKTSWLAVASAVFVLLAFLCLALTCGIATHDVIMPTIALVFSALGLILGIIALVNIVAHRRKLGGASYAIVAIIVAVYFLSVLPLAIVRVRRCAWGAVCQSNLHQLACAINQYAKAHKGYLPTADKWCDLLVEDDEKLPRDCFKCPAAKGGICNYAFNKNLDGLRLKDIPKDLALVFEADGGWNVSGGEELLKMRHKGTDKMMCNVLYSDFSIRLYYEEDFAKEPLRWKP